MVSPSMAYYWAQEATASDAPAACSAVQGLMRYVGLELALVGRLPVGLVPLVVEPVPGWFASSSLKAGRHRQGASGQ